MIIRNGVALGYPFVEAISAVIDYVDEMVVADGGSEDETWQVLTAMAQSCPKLVIHKQPWPSVGAAARCSRRPPTTRCG